MKMMRWNINNVVFVLLLAVYMSKIVHILHSIPTFLLSPLWFDAFALIFRCVFANKD